MLAVNSIVDMKEWMRGEFWIERWLVQPSINKIAHGCQTIREGPKVMSVLPYLARHKEEKSGQFDRVEICLLSRSKCPSFAQSV